MGSLERRRVVTDFEEVAISLPPGFEKAGYAVYLILV